MDKFIIFSSSNSKRYYESLGRMLFYFLIVYGAVQVGSSVLILMPVLYLKCLVISGMFLPFIFVYSMLFELADKTFFPKKITEKEALYEYLLGRYSRIGWVGVIVLVIFLLSVYFSLSNNYLPAEVYPVALPLEFVAVCTLFASKYHKLEHDRSGEGETLSIIHLTAFKFFVVAFAIVLLLLNFFYFDRVEYSIALGVAGVLLVLLFAMIAVTHYWSRSGNKSVKDEESIYFYERPRVREFLLQLSITVVPFFVGLYSALYIAAEDHFSALFVVVGSRNVISVLFLLIILGVVLENMRYMGRYDDSYNFRTSKTRDDLADAFKNSHEKFLLLVAVYFSMVPILMVLAEYTLGMIILLACYLLSILVALSLVLRPFDEMGIDSVEKTSSGKVKVKIITPAQALIGIKILGFIFLLVLLRAGNLYFQKSPVFYDGKHFYSVNYDQTIKLPDEVSNEGFLRARFSPDLAPKMRLMKFVDPAEFMLIFDSLRFGEGHLYILDGKEHGIEKTKQTRSWDEFYLQRGMQKSIEDNKGMSPLLYFALSIYVALFFFALLNASKGDFWMQLFKRIAVYGFFLLFFLTLFNLKENMFFIRLWSFDVFCYIVTFVKYDNYAAMSYFYVILSVAILLAALFQKWHEETLYAQRKNV